MRSIKEKENILFSVIVPIYNAEHTIERTIQSILKQTFQNYELLLIDDCSTDNSFSIAQKYDNEYSQVHAIQMPENSGSAKAPREYGAKLAKGKFVVPVDSDDVVNEEYLAGFENILFEHDEIDIVIPIMRNIDADTQKEICAIPDKDFDMSLVLSGPEACRMVMTQWTFCAMGAYCRELFINIIKKNPYYYMNSDEMTSRLLLYHARKVAFSRKSEYLYYWSNTSITHKRSVKLFDPLYTDTHLISFAEAYYDKKMVQKMCSKMLSHMICLYKDYNAESRYTTEEQKRIDEIFRETYSFLQSKEQYLLSMKSRFYLSNWYVFVFVCRAMMLSKK